MLAALRFNVSPLLNSAFGWPTLLASLSALLRLGGIENHKEFLMKYYENKEFCYDCYEPKVLDKSASVVGYGSSCSHSICVGACEVLALAYRWFAYL